MEAESAPSDLIEQFCSITGADKGKAGFFLAAAGNDLNTAMNEYFASNTGPRQVGFSSNQDEEGQQLYAGGASRHGGSGVNVIGAPKKKSSPNLGEDSDSIVRNVFQQAREAGAEELDTHRSEFGGRGMDTRGGSSGQESKKVVLKMWKNGFTIDDGELRDFNGNVGNI